MNARYYKTRNRFLSIALLPLVAVLLLLGCSRADDWHAQLADDEAETHAKGWTSFETLGDPGPWTGDFWIESETASSVTVGWVLGGKQGEKKYYQTNYVYYAHNYVNTNGDAFVIVYRRDKPKH